MTKLKVAFICVHNSCRSQIAETLAKHYWQDEFVFYSAGSHIKSRINPDAVRLVKKEYGIDMEKDQYPKLMADLPPIDVVITMGCHVECPYLGCTYRCDWGLNDPSGQSDEVFNSVIKQIEMKVKALKKDLQAALVIK